MGETSFVWCIWIYKVKLIIIMYKKTHNWKQPTLKRRTHENGAHVTFVCAFFVWEIDNTVQSRLPHSNLIFNTFSYIVSHPLLKHKLRSLIRDICTGDQETNKQKKVKKKKYKEVFINYHCWASDPVCSCWTWRCTRMSVEPLFQRRE